MKQFPWNVGEKRVPFWDEEKDLPTQLVTSLKYRLKNQEGHIDNAIRDIASGLAMIMEEIEEMKETSERLE